MTADKQKWNRIEAGARPVAKDGQSEGRAVVKAEGGRKATSLEPGRKATSLEPGRKAPGAFRTISEVADELGIPQHVLRFWESKFAQIKPVKRGGGRRYYRPEDVDLLRAIQALLYDDKYTIKGAQQLIREQGVKTIIQTFGGFAGAAAQIAEQSVRPGLAGAKPDGAVPDAGLDGLRAVLQELEAIRAALTAPPRTPTSH